MQALLSVREIEARDIALIADYWLLSEPAFLQGMGVELSKVPARNDLEHMLSAQLQQSYDQKQAYCLIWEQEGKAVGHCNVNKISFGQEAYMHLHLWQTALRQKGLGLQLLHMSLPYFFRNLQLQMLRCEPYALNPAPNKTLARAGFRFVREYTTIPGYLNFEQPVNHWELSREQFSTLTL